MVIGGLYASCTIMHGALSWGGNGDGVHFLGKVGGDAGGPARGS